LNYLRHDVLALREALQEILTTLQTIFPSFGNVLPATVGSLAMRIFRMSLKKDLVTSPRVLDQFEREGYFGGLVGCIQKGLYSGVWGIDVNSMYPSVMVGQLYPYSYFGYWTYDWESDGVGLWKCRIKYPPGYSGVKWLYDISRMLIVDEGVCVIDTETVEYLMANNYHVQVIMGYRYLDLSDDMFQYMDSLYALKKEGGTKKTTVKYILNSTYGKFGQKHERTKISTLKDANELIQLINRGISVHEYDFGKQQIYTWTDRELSTNTFCIIAALVTARARLKLVKAMSSLTSIGYRVLYYDTDSIHFIPIGGFDLEACEREGVFIHPNDLGSWGIQFENAEAGYAGRKLYYYTEGEKKGKVVAKGVSGFTQMDMKRLILDGEKEGSYLSCTSPRKVLFQNVNPGVFSKYTRMVRVLNEKEVK
jgi:DNA polymerase elongation subunit (family B)